MTSTQTMPLPPTDPAPRNNGKPLNIILAVLGGLVILSLIVGATRSAVATLNRDYFTQSAPVQGVTALDISAGSGAFTMRFEDTTEARLEVTSSVTSGWDLVREGNKLVVQSPNPWNNFCFFGCGFDENQATLILPEAMNDGTLDAKFKLSAGDFDAVGAYKNLSVDVGAGELDLSGAAQNVEVRLGAGEAKISLKNVQQATFDISAGSMVGSLTGTVPQKVTADVSAGSFELALPEAAYDVRQTTAAGTLENLLKVDPESEHEVFVDLSAGDATLYPANAAPAKWKR